MVQRNKTNVIIAVMQQTDDILTNVINKMILHYDDIVIQ